VPSPVYFGRAACADRRSSSRPPEPLAGLAGTHGGCENCPWSLVPCPLTEFLTTGGRAKTHKGPRTKDKGQTKIIAGPRVVWLNNGVQGQPFSRAPTATFDLTPC